MVKRTAPASGGLGRHAHAAITSTNPAARPDAGNGASAAAAPTHRASQAHGSSPAMPHVAHDHCAGIAIKGQVASISHAGPASTDAPAAGHAISNAVPISTSGTTTSV